MALRDSMNSFKGFSNNAPMTMGPQAAPNQAGGGNPFQGLFGGGAQQQPGMALAQGNPVADRRAEMLKSLLESSNGGKMDLAGLTELLSAPKPEEEKGFFDKMSSGQRALLEFGLGTLAANKPGTTFGQAIGAGGQRAMGSDSARKEKAQSRKDKRYSQDRSEALDILGIGQKNASDIYGRGRDATTDARAAQALQLQLEKFAYDKNKPNTELKLGEGNKYLSYDKKTGQMTPVLDNAGNPVIGAATRGSGTDYAQKALWDYMSKNAGEMSSDPEKAAGLKMLNDMANPPQVVKTKAEYDSLPSGASFVDPNGNRRTKP